VRENWFICKLRNNEIPETIFGECKRYPLGASVLGTSAATLCEITISNVMEVENNIKMALSCVLWKSLINFSRLTRKQYSWRSVSTYTYTHTNNHADRRTQRVQRCVDNLMSSLYFRARFFKKNDLLKSSVHLTGSHESGPRQLRLFAWNYVRVSWLSSAVTFQNWIKGCPAPTAKKPWQRFWLFSSQEKIPNEPHLRNEIRSFHLSCQQQQQRTGSTLESTSVLHQ